MATYMTYSLSNFNDIMFNGFSFDLSPETLAIISKLSSEVGSPNYVKTPIFNKKEHPVKSESQPSKDNFRRKKNNKSVEVVNDEDWEALRNFQSTKIEKKTGADAHFDIIRGYLNKLTDKNYVDIKNKIIETIEQIIVEELNVEDMYHISSSIFEIASTNRFFSKVYADLYTDLINKYDMMRTVFKNSFEKFTELFNNIEYVEASVDYDKLCRINKDNEKRKALSTFFVNLMGNEIISKEEIISITRILLAQIYNYISEENKVNEVNELTENVAILYKKELYEDDEDSDNVSYELIEGYTISEIIERIANSKSKDYKSLSSKTIFKFMDLIDM